MDVAIVTGAATGIGLAISRRLVAMGCRVYGLGGNFRETSYSHEYFIPTPCDLRDIEDIEEKINHVLNREGDVYVLVNNAKSFGTTSFLDKFNLRELETTLQINLLCPLVLIRLLLPGLKQLQGFVVNIAPTSAETAKGGPAGAAAAGGLRWMGESLFDECRDSGVKVSTVFPQANPPNPSRHLDSSDRSPQTAIDTEAVAEAVERIVRHSEGNIVTEMVIRPQRLTEQPIPPPFFIPYPPPPKEAAPEKTKANVGSLTRTGEAIKAAAKRAGKGQRSRETASRAQKKIVATPKRKGGEKPLHHSAPKKKVSPGTSPSRVSRKTSDDQKQVPRKRPRRRRKSSPPAKQNREPG